MDELDNSHPIFIVGTERSGSNLLRLILNTHSNITVPHPPHIMHFMGSLEGRYGDLNEQDNFYRLVADVLGLIDIHIYPWDVKLDIDQLISQAPSRDLFGVFVTVYNAYLKASNKKRWACKSTFMVEHADAIFRLFPHAKLLWLVRDPRDVAVSSMHSVFNPFHPYHTARLWHEQQQKGLALANGPYAENVLQLHYEYLIAQPEVTVKKICAFIDEPFESTMLAFAETPEAKLSGTLSESWKNTAKPIMSNNAGKYKKRLSSIQIKTVERAAGKTMVNLGYTPDNTDWQSHTIGPVSRALFGVQDTLLNIQVQIKSLLNDKNFGRRIARRLYLTKLSWVRRSPPTTHKHLSK